MPLFAQVSLDNHLSKKQASLLLSSYNEEPDSARPLFGVVGAITRAGQKLDNASWVKFDEFGGRLTQYQDDDWDSLTSRARKLKTKEVENVFAV